MKETGQILLSRIDDVLEVWAEDVRYDIGSDFSVEMTYEAIRSRLPWLIEMVAAALESIPLIETQAFQQQAMFRVELGFDVAEMLREFKLLRRAIFQVLRPDLEKRMFMGVTDVSTAIDDVLNCVTNLAIERNARYQAKKVDPSYQALLSSNQELLCLLQAQKDNAAYLAHELKNPLNAILAFSSILMRRQKDELASEKDLHQLDRIHENGQQILRLINNMLEVSRSESAFSTLTVEPVEVTTLVTTITQSLMPQAIEKGLKLSVNCDSSPPQVHTDRLRLHQIVVNLISNAIRYTDQGNISVYCTLIDESRWTLSVKDTGRGISPATQRRIFEPYFQDESEGPHAVESSGLGLTIVKNLVQLLQGEINLVSEPQKGSTFTVLLPMDVTLR